MIQVSAVLNVHNEEDLIGRSFNSLKKCIKHAADNNIKTELIIIADNPSNGIITYFENNNDSSYEFYVVYFQDPSLSRNFGAEKSNGKYIVFFDGDDLWSSNWLTECLIASEKSRNDIICHPEASLYFEQKNQIFFHADSEEDNFNAWQLIENNYWTSQVFLKREVFLANPQFHLNIENGFGYEDWQWNCMTLAKNIQHKIIAGTYHFIRNKKMSQSVSSRNNNCLLPPSSLFFSYLPK